MLTLLDQVTTLKDDYKLVLEPYLLSIFGSEEEAERVAKDYRLEEWPPKVDIEEVRHNRTDYMLHFTHTFKLRRKTAQELDAEKSAEGISPKTI